MTDKNLNDKKSGQGSPISVQFQPDEKTLATMRRLDSRTFSNEVRKTTASLSNAHLIK